MKLFDLYKFTKLANSDHIVEQALKFQEEEMPEEIKGDGNAEFLPDFTQDEMETYIHEETHGWGKFYKRMFGE